MSDLKEIAKKSIKEGLFLFFGNISEIAVGLVYSILIARTLGPENFALYSVSLILADFFITISQMGIPPACARAIKKCTRVDTSKKAFPSWLQGVYVRVEYDLAVFYSLSCTVIIG